MLGWLTLAAIPAVIALPWLLDPFQLDAGRSAAEIPPLHRACVAMAITSTLSLAVGLLGARFGSGFELPQRPPGGRRPCHSGGARADHPDRARGALPKRRGPERIRRSAGGPAHRGTPDLASQGSRYGLNVSSDRGEFWRVALDDFDRHPLDGDGAGGFRASYLLHGEAGVQPEDPHSIEMLMLSELGIPGALLLLAFVGGGAVAIVRSRRLGREEAMLAAAALAVGSYWFAHASVDWFWSYAAITLPAPFVIGAAAAPALGPSGFASGHEGGRRPRSARDWLSPHRVGSDDGPLLPRLATPTMQSAPGGRISQARTGISTTPPISTRGAAARWRPRLTSRSQTATGSWR